MKKTTANFKITDENKQVSILTDIQIFTKPSGRGYISVLIPSLAIDTIAKDENDVAAAVNEAVCSFFIIAEKFGKGIEEELKLLN